MPQDVPCHLLRISVDRSRLETSRRLHPDRVPVPSPPRRLHHGELAAPILTRSRRNQTATFQITHIRPLLAAHVERAVEGVRLEADALLVEEDPEHRNNCEQQKHAVEEGSQHDRLLAAHRLD